MKPILARVVPRSERGRGRALFAIGVVGGILCAAVLVPAFSDERPVHVAANGAARDSADGAAQSSSSSSGDATEAEAGATGPDAAGSGGAGGATAQGGSASKPGAGRSPSQGVSTGDIKLGVVVLDLAAVSRTGLGTATADTSVDETKDYFQFFADEVNAQGGVLGRKITLAFTTFDPLDSSTPRRACLDLTEDAKVFAAVLPSGFFAEPVLCFTEEHHTPTLAFGGEAGEWYRRSRGLLFSASMSGTRNVRSLALRLHADKALAGKKIGIVSTNSPTEKLPVDEGLLPELKALGYTVAYRSTMSQNTDQQPSQIPVEISQMRRAGVDFIFWVTHALVFAQWTQQADSQGYRPAYALTDIQAGSNDFTVENVPKSTQAVVLTTNRDGEQHANLPEAPRDKECRSRYERAKKMTFERGSSDYFTVIRACAWLDLFATAARAAGPQLTAETFSQALQHTNGFDFPWMAPGSFGPGKFDFADGVRLKRYDGQCGCWMPSEDFHPGASFNGYGG